jgi:hypothetical protein
LGSNCVGANNYGILLPPNVTVTNCFASSLGRVPVLPLPKGKEFGYEVFKSWHKEVVWLDPQYDAGSAHWPA